ncbi:hypothetical protein [Niabella hibiscisoli]|uniref:hypothetical protein n=1 Tax=Niabella hibiscisoli TaxID=1825928 RepID=UPI001F0DADE0|nr:hypothetical protein [Niabella hibiscisoli]MCH5719434.1 hypothetical protein [Niabella hibiscisoli]
MKTIMMLSLLLGGAAYAGAQVATGGNAIENQKVLALADLYQSYMGVEAPLFNGPIYIDYAHTISGNLPFWNGSRDFIKGSVVYNDILYKEVLINYDVYKDKLLIQHPVNYKIFEIPPQEITYFEFSGRKFVPLTASEEKLRTGFYELVFAGHKSVIYGKQVKELSQDLSENTTRYHFKNSTVYYVYKEGRPFKITNVKSLVQAYKNDQVRDFIKSNKPDIKSDFPGTLKSVATYYEKL